MNNVHPYLYVCVLQCVAILIPAISLLCVCDDIQIYAGASS